MTARSVVGSVLASIARPVLGQGAGFSIDAFMAAQSDGLYFDTTKLDRFFQESTGPTLTDSVGYAIGLGLDQRTWAKAYTPGPNLIDPPFVVPSGYDNTISAQDSTSFSTTFVATSARVAVNLTGLQVGEAYELSYVGSPASGSVQGFIRTAPDGTGTNLELTSPVSNQSGNTLFFVATTTGHSALWVNPSASFSVSNIVVRKAPYKTLAQVLAGQSEKVVNGGFVTDISSWIVGGSGANTVTWDTGRAKFNSDGTFVSLIQYPGLTAGKTYKATFEVEVVSGAGLRFDYNLDGTPVLNSLATTTGSYTLYFTPTAAGVRFARIGATVAHLDNVSIKEVPGNHALQSSSSLRPLRQATGAKFDGSDDNLLTNYYANVQADGPELISNGGFDSDSSWTISASGTTISGGALNWDGSAGAFGTNFVSQNGLSVSTSKLYAVTYTVTRIAGSIRVNLGLGGATAGPARSASGTYTNYIAPTGSQPTTLSIQGDNFNGTVDNVSVKEVTNQNNFMVALVDVPASIASTQMFFGASDGAPGNRFFIGFNSNGTLGAGVGANSTGVIVGSADRRGTTVVVGVSFDGSTVRLFDDNTIVYQSAQSGVPSSFTAARIGSQNSGGTASNFFGGSIKKLVAGREFLTLERYKQIRNALLA